MEHGRKANRRSVVFDSGLVLREHCAREQPRSNHWDKTDT